MDPSPPPTFNRFLHAITQRPGDPTFSLLKTHLVFEELLLAFIGRKLPNAPALEGARLTFAQRLAVARACLSPGDDSCHWEALKKLNKLRNQLSHHLKPEKLNEEMNEYVSFVVQCLGVPLPAALSRPELIGSITGPIYFPIDIANAGLLAVLCERLGFPDPDLWE